MHQSSEPGPGADDAAPTAYELTFGMLQQKDLGRTFAGRRMRLEKLVHSTYICREVILWLP